MQKTFGFFKFCLNIAVFLQKYQQILVEILVFLKILDFSENTCKSLNMNNFQLELIKSMDLFIVEINMLPDAPGLLPGLVGDFLSSALYGIWHILPARSRVCSRVAPGLLPGLQSFIL